MDLGRIAIFNMLFLLKELNLHKNGLYNQLKLIGINEINKNIDWLSTNISEINKDNIILMVPGVSKSGKDKQWSPDNFAKLASSLEKEVIIFVLLDKNQIEKQ